MGTGPQTNKYLIGPETPISVYVLSLHDTDIFGCDPADIPYKEIDV
jgi:hypothetical protein